MNKIAIYMARVTTPPSLFGIDRKVAYANMKYNSGWMCIGVTSEFAGVNLSGSLRMYGSSGSGVAHSIEFCFVTT